MAGNISPKFVDRLALTVSSVRTVRPLEIGAKSATFTVCRVDSGRISGVSSTVLHHFRKFDCPFNARVFEIEKLMINCRSDLKEIVMLCCANNELSEDVAETFLQHEIPVPMSLTDECNESAKVFNMNCLMRMKDYVENCPDDLTTRDHSFTPLVFGHKLDDYGCEPRTISRTISENANLFPFVYAFITQDSVV